MEAFEAIVSGNFSAVVEAYMQALADGEMALPDVAVGVCLNDVGLDEDEMQQALQVLYDIGFAEEQLEEEEVRVSALGLICLVSESNDEIAEAILWHNVYYKLGLVKDMAVVSIGGEVVDELQSVEAILRVRGLEEMVELQYSIYNNLPPF